MSLDVYLQADNVVTRGGSGIFVRENGRTVEISRAEWDEKFPDREPVIAEIESEEFYNGNITHNLNTMAYEAGLYGVLWRPEENAITHASQLITPLSDGLAILKGDPERFRKFNPSNGWGRYETLVEFVTEYLSACKQQPGARVRVWR